MKGIWYHHKFYFLKGDSPVSQFPTCRQVTANICIHTWELENTPRSTAQTLTFMWSFFSFFLSLFLNSFFLFLPLFLFLFLVSFLPKSLAWTNWLAKNMLHDNLLSWEKLKKTHTHGDSSFQSPLLAQIPLNDASVVFFLWGFKCYLACLQWKQSHQNQCFYSISSLCICWEMYYSKVSFFPYSSFPRQEPVELNHLNGQISSLPLNQWRFEILACHCCSFCSPISANDSPSGGGHEHPKPGFSSRKHPR